MTTKILGIKKSAWLAFFVSLVASFLMTAVTHAQTTDDQVASKYGVTFPVKELGNCANISDCRNFCEDPVNSSACISYAKSKGFYKEEDANIKKKEGILEKARTELGCDSIESCKSFCQIPTNFEKCDAFAKNEGIAGGQVEDPKKAEIVAKAKEVLGCDSYSGCASFCSDDQNRQKCSEFAKETGLRGGERPVGPGGCTSEGSCKSFCSDPQNFQVCKGFVSSSGGKFQGPGGCDSEDSCRSYCERNPQSCGSGRGGGPVPVPVKYDPQEMCNRTPACSWKNNTCQCGSYKDEETRKRSDEYSKLCRENPERCTPGGIGGTESKEDRATFERYCRENPEKCKPVYSNYTRGTYDPASECSKYSGCSWTNGTCQCSSKYENVTPSASGTPSRGGTTGGAPTSGGSNGGYGSRDDQERGCRSGGGSCDWSYGYCSCKGYQSPGSTGGSAGGNTSGGYTGSSGSYSGRGSYSSREQQEAGCRSGGGTCSWNGDTCNCQGYRAPSSGSYTGSGGGYTGGSAPDPATGCRNAGGSWNGSSCQMPTNTQSNPTQNTAPSGMNRESQEAGCRSCGGSCNWNGDFCNCQCGSSGSSVGSAPAPAPVQNTAPAPQPEQQSQPAPQPAAQEPAPAPPATEPAPAPAVQGITAVRSILDKIFDFFR